MFKQMHSTLAGKLVTRLAVAGGLASALALAGPFGAPQAAFADWWSDQAQMCHNLGTAFYTPQFVATCNVVQQQYPLRQDTLGQISAAYQQNTQLQGTIVRNVQLIAQLPSTTQSRDAQRVLQAYAQTLGQEQNLLQRLFQMVGQLPPGVQTQQILLQVRQQLQPLRQN
jgi:hypothetical protein